MNSNLATLESSLFAASVDLPIPFVEPVTCNLPVLASRVATCSIKIAFVRMRARAGKTFIKPRIDNFMKKVAPDFECYHCSVWSNRSFSPCDQGRPSHFL